MNYKNVCSSFLVVVIASLCLIYPVLFYLQLGVPTERTRYLDEWWNKKLSYASSIKGNKLLVISGSNTLFSVRTELMEKYLQMPVVNLGVHAGLGLKYILHRSKIVIKENDTVILPLEYEMYDDVENFGGEFGWYVSARDKQYFIDKPLFEKVMFIYAIKPEDILYALKEKFKPSKRKVGGYDSKYLNKNGDMLNNLYEKKRTQSELLAVMKENVFVAEQHPSAEFKEVIKDFLRYCSEKSVRVIVAYPAYYSKDKCFKGDDLEQINAIDFYWKNLDIFVLSDYSKNLYDIDYFYDGNYHMNDRGSEKRTLQMIKELKALM